MKKTLFHSLTFPPDTISTGMIVSEIAEGINTELQNVEVLASSPQYNMESVELFDNSDENLSIGSYKNIKINYIKSSYYGYVMETRLLAGSSLVHLSLKVDESNFHIFYFQEYK